MNDYFLYSVELNTLSPTNQHVSRFLTDSLHKKIHPLEFIGIDFPMSILRGAFQLGVKRFCSYLFTKHMLVELLPLDLGRFHLVSAA